MVAGERELRSALQARQQVRAQRHADSLPPAVIGLGIAALAVAYATGPSLAVVALTPVVVFAVLALANLLLAKRRGMGAGSDGYLVLLLAGVLLVTLLPGVLVALGSLTVLGLGLLLLSVRGSNWEHAVAGAIVTGAGLWTHWTNLLPFPPDIPAGLLGLAILVACAISLVMLAARSFVAERRSLGATGAA